MEASYWWRTNAVAGAILHRLMWVFIAISVVLVVKGYSALSLVVLLAMIPYGFFLRYLAQRALASFIEGHPETIQEFEEQGIITR